MGSPIIGKSTFEPLRQLELRPVRAREAVPIQPAAPADGLDLRHAKGFELEASPSAGIFGPMLVPTTAAAQSLSARQQAIQTARQELRATVRLAQSLSLLSPQQQDALRRELAATGSSPALAGMRAADRGFVEAFLALAPAEQQVAQSSMAELAIPPVTGFREFIRSQMATLPRERQMAVGKALNQAGVYLPSTSVQAPTAEDFSSRIHKMLIPVYLEGSSQAVADYVRDLIKVASVEGFTLTMPVGEQDPQALRAQIIRDLVSKEKFSPEEAAHLVAISVEFVAGRNYKWSEDNKLFTVDGEMLVPASLSAEARSFVKSFTQAEVASGPAANMEGYPRTAQGHVSDHKAIDSALRLADSLGVKARRAKTGNEFGNTLIGNLPNGEPYALIGRDGLLLAAKDLKWSDTQLNQARARLNPDAQELEQVKQRLVAARQVPEGRSPEAEALDLMTRIELAKTAFADDLGIPAQNLVFVDQPDFHIDMHVRPLKPGQVMINDSSETLAMLTRALARPESSPEDRAILANMLAEQQRIQQDYQPVVERIAAQLKTAGLEVVRAPGVMSGRSGSREEYVNFMNAVPGTSLGTNRQFFLSNHTPLAALRVEFSDFMQAQGVAEVYWVGDNANQTSFRSTQGSGTMMLKALGGLDCLENRIEYR